eukprot:gene5603-7735_t
MYFILCSVAFISSLGVADGFRGLYSPMPGKSLAIFSDSGSALPGFDGIFSPKDDSSKLSNDSPLVDRALDSALDFLQDAEAGAADEDDEFDMFEIYEDSPDIDIPHDLIAELEEKEATALANKLPSAAELNQVKIDAAVAKWRKHDKDVGSAEVQVAIANEKIKYLTQHLLRNKKDVAAKRGLNALVNTRRKFLNYLFETDQSKANEMISEMGIRFRPPGRLWDKEAKYGAFKNTKTKFLKAKPSKSKPAPVSA